MLAKFGRCFDVKFLELGIAFEHLEIRHDKSGGKLAFVADKYCLVDEARCAEQLFDRRRRNVFASRCLK